MLTLNTVDVGGLMVEHVVDVENRLTPLHCHDIQFDLQVIPLGTLPLQFPLELKIHHNHTNASFIHPTAKYKYRTSRQDGLCTSDT